MTTSCALSMTHVKIYLSALKVLRIPMLILSKKSQRSEDDVSLEGAPRLTIDPDNFSEVENITID